MNKNELISRVQKNIEIEVTKKDLGIIIDGVLNAIERGLTDGEKIKITNFGTFETIDRAEHEARNPKTGEKVIVPASKAVKFRVSDALKVAVNA